MFYAAEFNKNKNQQLLIKALALIKDEVPSAKLLLAGEGPLLMKCRNLAVKLNVEHMVNFLGYRNDIPSLLPMCDIAVSSSLREGLPVNVMEAMACGLPIVATENRGHTELVRDEVNGYIVPPHDSGLFASRLLRLAKSMEQCKRMGLENNQIIQTYSLSNVKDHLSRVYKDYKVIETYEINSTVSIVVPIYNMESCLGRCLDSLLSQSFRNIEIITVNDGSTDKSLEILQKYAEKDSRVVILDKENGGVSSARNEGMRAAQGEYIGFVDPDDWVNPDMYGEMVQTAVNERADIVMCTYIREFGTHSKEKIFNLPKKVRYNNNEVHSKIMRRLVGPLDEEVANPEMLDAWGTVWSKLYRTDLIKENNLHFIDLCVIGSNEDSLFNIHAFYYAESFVFLNQPYYHYWRANTNSVTSKHNPSLMNQFFNLYSYIESFLIAKKMEKVFFAALNNRISLNTLGLGLNTISKGNKAPVLMKIKSLSLLLNDSRIKASLKQFEMSNSSMVWRTFFFCAKVRFAAGFYLMLASVDLLRRTLR